MSRLQTVVLALFVAASLLIGFYAIQATSDLRFAYSSLREKFEKLTIQYDDLLARSQALESSYNELNSSYMQVREENERLANESLKLRQAVDDLRDELTSLRGSLSRVEKLYQALSANYSLLSSNYTALKKDYDQLKLLLESLSTKVLIEPKNLPKIIKGSFLESSSIRSLAIDRLKLSRSERPAEKAEKVTTWILTYLQYIPDDFHEVVVDGKLLKVMDRISSPAETLSRGGGDCEDLALLSYALLAQALGDRESIYLIGLRGALEIGHIALLYKVGESFMVIDPAGLYLTDISYALKTSFKKDLGEATAYLNPLSINPNLKLQLIEDGVAELQPVYGSSIGLKPAEEAIPLWVEKWESQIPLAYVSFIANSTFYKTFNSTEEFIEFIGLGGLS